MTILKDNVCVAMLGMLGLALALTLTTPTPADAARGNNNGNGRGHRADDGGGTPALDPGAMAGALTLLVGGAAIVIERRRSRSRSDES